MRRIILGMTAALIGVAAVTSAGPADAKTKKKISAGAVIPGGNIAPTGNGRANVAPVNLPINLAPQGSTSKSKLVVQQYVIKNQKSLSPRQKDALNRLLSGQALSAQDRLTLSDLAASSDAAMTPEVREAISQALVEDAESRRTALSTRYLRVYNASGEALRVWVQYEALTESEKWVWFPDHPEQSAKAVAFDLKPGEARALVHEEWPIHAARVRLWARSTSGKEWRKFKDQDLQLVPEVDDAGRRRYVAAETETYTHAFQAAPTVLSGRAGK